MPRILVAFLFVALPTLSLAADDDAKTVAQAFLDKGAGLFSDKDAPSLAKTYTDDAELAVVMKGSSETKQEVKRGPAEIENYYRELFKTNDPIRAKNTIEYARYIDPELLMVAGVFEIRHGDTDLKLPFVQIRQKQGDSWKIHRLRVFYVGK
jgi:ketosteroid isomerase-like protein